MGKYNVWNVYDMENAIILYIHSTDTLYYDRRDRMPRRGYNNNYNASLYNMRIYNNILYADNQRSHGYTKRQLFKGSAKRTRSVIHLNISDQNYNFSVTIGIFCWVVQLEIFFSS